MMLVKYFFFKNKLANICWTSLTHYTLKGNSYFCESANVPSPVDIIAPNVNVCTRGQYCVCVKMWISLLLNQLELKFKVCIKTRVPWNPTIHGNECFLPSCGQTDLMWRGGETPRNRQAIVLDAAVLHDEWMLYHGQAWCGLIYTFFLFWEIEKTGFIRK